MQDNDITDIKFSITAGPWINDGTERRWSGPPPTDEDPERDLAARIEKRRAWPFTVYDWYVYSPFCKESVLEGTAKSLETARAEANTALMGLCAAVTS